MKIPSKNIENFIKNPSSDYKVILIFGADSGVASEYAESIINKKIGDDPFGRTELSSIKIAEDPSILFQELSAVNLFGYEPIIFIRDVADSVNKITISTTIIEAIEHKSCKNLLLMQAGELDNKSKLRAYCEKAKNIAVIPCYHDDGANLAKIIRRELDKNEIKYDNDLIIFLRNILGNDRGITISEIERIATYLGDKKYLNIEIASEIIINNSDKNLSKLSNAIADGKVNDANILCKMLLGENVAIIVILRSLMYYFNRVAQIQDIMKNGENAKSALEKLRPPVFWKQKESLINHAINIRNIKGILSFLIQAELKFKNGYDAEISCIYPLTAIARMNMK